MLDQIGNDIITTDGTTLLGADDKAGLAEIMTAAQFLVDNPDIKHGTIKLLFTPDEEIGRGVDKVDLKKLGADFAYTRGRRNGRPASKTRRSRPTASKITIQGVAIHPGFAKGKDGKRHQDRRRHHRPAAAGHGAGDDLGQGGLRSPDLRVTGSMEKAVLSLIVRDFDEAGLAAKEAMLEALVKDVMADYPRLDLQPSR